MKYTVLVGIVLIGTGFISCKSNASALDLTNEVIDKIGAMYFGKREVDKLKKNNAY